MAVDDVEFREFFASQYGRLCWLGLLLTGDRTEAEELAQEALARTWWRWAVRRPNDPAAYARKVLVNRRRSLLRRAGVEARFLARARAEAVPPPGDEQALVLWQAVRDLPLRQRSVLVLRFHEDLTEVEVARLLGLPSARSSRWPTAAWPGCASGSAHPTSTRPPPPGGRRDDPGTAARGPSPHRPPPPRGLPVARRARRLRPVPPPSRPPRPHARRPGRRGPGRRPGPGRRHTPPAPRPPGRPRTRGPGDAAAGRRFEVGVPAGWTDELGPRIWSPGRTPAPEAASGPMRRAPDTMVWSTPPS